MKNKKGITLIALIIIIFLFVTLLVILTTLIIGKNGLIERVRINKKEYKSGEQELQYNHIIYSNDFSTANATITIFNDNGIDTIECPQIGDQSAIIINCNGAKKMSKDYVGIPVEEDIVFRVKPVNGDVYEEVLRLNMPYETQYLACPILTNEGVMNLKYVDPDNESNYFYGLDLNYNCNTNNLRYLDTKGFDGDVNTDATIVTSVEPGWIDVDESAWGGQVTVARAHNCATYWKNSEGKTIGNGASFNCDAIDRKDLIFTVPQGATRLYFSTYANRLGNLYLGEVAIKFN